MGFLDEAGEMLNVHDGEPPFVGEDGVDALESPLRAEHPPKKVMRSIIVRAENTDRARVIAGGRRFAYGRGLGLRMERLGPAEGPGNRGRIAQILLPENMFQQEKVFSYNLIVH
jgi:hypothetical protein